MTGRIFQPIRGRGLRKLLWKRLHLPRAVVHPALSAAKAIANPAQVRLRRELAGDCAAAFDVPPEAGFRLLAGGDLPGADVAASRCAEIYAKMRAGAQVDDHLFNPRKRYLLALLAGGDFCSHPELIRFMVSRKILDVASEYLGAVPLLAGAVLWWTPENETVLRSQRYHLDGEDESQVKVVMNLFETMIPAIPCGFSTFAIPRMNA